MVGSAVVTVATTVNTTSAPEAMLEMVHVLPLMVPLLGVNLTSDKPAPKVMVEVTLLVATGEPFLTVKVKVALLPSHTTGAAPAVMFTLAQSLFSTYIALLAAGQTPLLIDHSNTTLLFSGTSVMVVVGE